MPENDTKKLQFRPRARIIRTIGDQLISGPEAAVIELVKNAYDADASFVSVKFVPPLLPNHGRIIVTDDGHGMTLSDIQQKWMEPATSSKVAVRLSPKRHRLMMGSKGIGRFAAAKLGRQMALNSISDRDGERTEVLIPAVDWSLFSGDTYLEDIKIDYLTQITERPTGTTIEIVRLNEGWNAAKLSRLHLELRRLISPLHSSAGDVNFKIYLDLSLCTPETTGFDGQLVVNPGADLPEGNEHTNIDVFEVKPFPLLSTCDYQLEGRFDSDGVFHGTFENKRAGQAVQTIELVVPLRDEEEPCGEVGVRLYVFDREADVIRETMRKAGLGELTAARARQILDEIAGIAIYRGGFRIRPYGDAANDWLTLDRRRVQNPSLRIGHNQVAGYISVEEQDKSGLIEKSSREGFEENSAFLRLKSLITDSLAQIVEPKRYKFRESAGLSRSRNLTFEQVKEGSRLDSVRKVLPSLDPESRERIETALNKESASLASKIDLLEDRQRILEATSTLGAIVREVLHEGAPEAGFIARTAGRLSRTYKYLFTSGPVSDETRAEFPSDLDALSASGTRLRELFAALKPLAGGKQARPEKFNPVNVIREAAAIYHGHEIPVVIENPDGITEAYGYRPDLNTALSNLVGNAIYWLEERRVKDPKIVVTLGLAGRFVSIIVEDNGPGVKAEFVASIFDVGFTLKDGGTGLGLNIAREALARSDATLEYDSEFENGARFKILFPAHEGVR